MFEYEVEIAKPLNEVYAAFNNPDNMPRWISGLQHTESILGEPGQVGSKTRQVYLERGRTIELIETITAHEPEKHFAGIVEGEGMSCDLEVDFIGVGDRTLVKMRSRFQPHGLVMRLMLPFYKGQIKKRQSGDLERFGELLESGELG